jgi:hypothetical protein
VVVSEADRQLRLPRGLLVLHREIWMVIHILHSRSRAMRGCSDQQSFLVLLEVIALSAGQTNSLPDYSSRVGAEAVVIQDQSIILAAHLQKKEMYCSSLRELCSCDSMDG